MGTLFSKKRHEELEAGFLAEFEAILAEGKPLNEETIRERTMHEMANATIHGKTAINRKTGEKYTAAEVKRARAASRALTIARGKTPPPVDWTRNKSFGVVGDFAEDAAEGGGVNPDDRAGGANTHAPSGAATADTAKPTVQGSGPRGRRQRRSVSDQKVLPGKYGDEAFAEEAMTRDLAHKTRLAEEGRARAAARPRKGKGQKTLAEKKAGGEGARDLLGEMIDAQVNNVIARKAGTAGVPDLSMVSRGARKNLTSVSDALAAAGRTQRSNPVSRTVGKVMNPGTQPPPKPTLSDYGYTTTTKSKTNLKKAGTELNKAKKKGKKSYGGR